MKEEDLVMARAMVAECAENPQAAKKTHATNVIEQNKKFR